MIPQIHPDNIIIPVNSTSMISKMLLGVVTEGEGHAGDAGQTDVGHGRFLNVSYAAYRYWEAVYFSSLV